MSQEAVFDCFYRDTRSDVLLQAFLLTGDLTAATSAVKDAYAVTWQHWKKVTKRQATGGPAIEYVRPLVWRLAQRRHTGRIWHRNKGLDESHREVLDVLHKLSAGQRRVLLLVDLAGVDDLAAARELALTPAAAKERLGKARAEVASTLGQDYVDRLRALGVPAASAKLPRPSIVLRAGRKRRRAATVGAVVGVVALTLGVGAVAREPGRERATSAHQLLAGNEPVKEQFPAGVELTGPEQLLEAYQLSDLAPAQSWDVVRTDDNTAGDGINTICQQTRFADPRGLAALVRTYEATGKPARDALQTVELSRDEASAQRTYDRTLGWFAGCQEARLRMLQTYDVAGVGDDAQLLRMQVAGDPSRTYDVAVARSGELTTSLVMETAGDDSPRPAALAAALGDAVANLCPTDHGCAQEPRAVRAAPPPSGEERGFVATVDLPPVHTIRQPWVGVPSVDALKHRDVLARCDRADFSEGGAERARARTFLMPEADVPPTFGFTETYGQFRSAQAASRFLEGVRRSVAGCEDRDPTAEVTSARSEAGPLDLSVWRFETSVNEDTTMPFRVGFVRNGNRVAKLSFVPDGKHDMLADDFTKLVRRAGERLEELP